MNTNQQNSSDEEMSSSSSSDSLSSDEEESSKRDDEWDEECYVCKKDGDVMCCETCTLVCHFKCTELKTKPTGEWYCTRCMVKRQRSRNGAGRSR